MTKSQWGVATLLGALALVLVVVNGVLFSGNRAAQLELNQRAQYVQQSIQLEGLFNEMVRALAELSARGNDQQLRQLLQDVGVSFTVAPPAPAASAAVPAGGKR